MIYSSREDVHRKKKEYMKRRTPVHESEYNFKLRQTAKLYKWSRFSFLSFSSNKTLHFTLKPCSPTIQTLKVFFTLLLVNGYWLNGSCCVCLRKVTFLFCFIVEARKLKDEDLIGKVKYR
jgi:hypothetical protein